MLRCGFDGKCTDPLWRDIPTCQRCCTAYHRNAKSPCPKQRCKPSPSKAPWQDQAVPLGAIQHAQKSAKYGVSQMHIYKVTRTDNYLLPAFDAFVCMAPNADTAANLDPRYPAIDESYFKDPPENFPLKKFIWWVRSDQESCWTNLRSQLSVTDIGTCDPSEYRTGLILKSYLN